MEASEFGKFEYAPTDVSTSPLEPWLCCDELYLCDALLRPRDDCGAAYHACYHLLPFLRLFRVGVGAYDDFVLRLVDNALDQLLVPFSLLDKELEFQVRLFTSYWFFAKDFLEQLQPTHFQ